MLRGDPSQKELINISEFLQFLRILRCSFYQHDTNSYWRQQKFRIFRQKLCAFLLASPKIFLTDYVWAIDYNFFQNSIFKFLNGQCAQGNCRDTHLYSLILLSCCKNVAFRKILLTEWMITCDFRVKFSKKHPRNFPIFSLELLSRTCCRAAPFCW